jgi:CHAT domain-containing protein
LPTSLLQAGAAGVLASLWSVEDISTALLMMRFYHNFMQEKQAPQIALREAQLWLRNARPRDYTEFLNANLPAEQAKILRQQIGTKSYSHPYYWGAFYYTGV